MKTYKCNMTQIVDSAAPDTNTRCYDVSAV